MDERYVSQREFTEVRVTQEAHTQKLASMGTILAKTEANVEKILTNHLPHIQAAVDRATNENRTIFMEARDSMLGWVTDQNKALGGVTSALGELTKRFDEQREDLKSVKEKQVGEQVEVARVTTRVTIYIAIAGFIVTSAVGAGIAAYVNTRVKSAIQEVAAER